MIKATLALLFLWAILLVHITFAGGRQKDQTQFEVTHKNFAEIFNEIKRKALIQAGELRNTEESRRVEKGNFPEIKIVKDNVYFNGGLMRFGDSMKRWKKIIGGNPRCYAEGMKLCVWDELGLKIATSSEPLDTVIILNLHMNVAEADADADSVTESDKARQKKYLPRKIFSGYLEIDGFGIDKMSEFFDIQSNVDPARNLHCGLRDCTFPEGIFSNAGNMYMKLDGGTRHARLLRFEIAISQNNIP